MSHNYIRKPDSSYRDKCTINDNPWFNKSIKSQSEYKNKSNSGYNLTIFKHVNMPLLRPMSFTLSAQNQSVINPEGNTRFQDQNVINFNSPVITA